MKKLSFSDWVQVVTSLSVLIGLMLVIYEIRQTHRLSQVQMVAENMAAFTQQQLSIAGENPATVMKKACHDEPLNQEELVVFDVIARTYALYASRILALDFLGDYDSRHVDEQAVSILRTLKSSELGRAWWQLNEPFLSEAVRQAGSDDRIAPVTECGDYMSLLQSLAEPPGMGGTQ